jgi:hypothetical protein
MNGVEAIGIEGAYPRRKRRRVNALLRRRREWPRTPPKVRPLKKKKK